MMYWCCMGSMVVIICSVSYTARMFARYRIMGIGRVCLFCRLVYRLRMFLNIATWCCERIHTLFTDSDCSYVSVHSFLLLQGLTQDFNKGGS